MLIAGSGAYFNDGRHFLKPYGAESTEVDLVPCVLNQATKPCVLSSATKPCVLNQATERGPWLN